MFGNWRTRRPSHSTVVSYLALFVALGGTSAYAANEWTGDNIVDESITAADILGKASSGGNPAVNGTLTTNELKNGTVRSVDVFDDSLQAIDLAAGSIGESELQNGSVTSPSVRDDSQPGGGLHEEDLAGDSVGAPEIKTDAVNATEIANNSIDSGEIVDFGLSNQDVGVEFAQINADGTVANSSGGVTTVHIGAGTYEVDFGHTISSCGFGVTQGEAGVGGAGGAITGATDRSGNAEAAFVTTRTNANALADRAFQMIVVC
jgi:hypothetical protein